MGLERLHDGAVCTNKASSRGCFCKTAPPAPPFLAWLLQSSISPIQNYPRPHTNLLVRPSKRNTCTTSTRPRAEPDREETSAALQLSLCKTSSPSPFLGCVTLPQPTMMTGDKIHSRPTVVSPNAYNPPQPSSTQTVGKVHRSPSELATTMALQSWQQQWHSFSQPGAVGNHA